MPVSWEDHELEAVTECAVCGRHDLGPLYRDLKVHDPEGWSIDRCKGCGTGHLNPRPTPQAIAKAYVGDYAPYVARPARADALGRVARVRRDVEDAYLARRWHYPQLASSSSLALLSIGMPSLRRTADRLVRFAPGSPVGARLLDIGCATGTYIEMMRDLGWQTRGVEMDAGAVETARRSGLEVRQGTMEDVNPDVDGTFDHVTVGHVIEHVHRPVDALHAAYRVLRPGGRLWIGTPNLASAASRLFRSRWRALEPPRHLVLFTPGSLALALRKAGFSEVQLVRSQPSAGWHLNESARLAGVEHRRPLAAAAHVVNAASYVRPDLSDEMTFIATRT